MKLKTAQSEAGHAAITPGGHRKVRQLSDHACDVGDRVVCGLFVATVTLALLLAGAWALQWPILGGA